MTECDKRMRDAQGETCEIEGMCVCEGREMSVFLCLCMHLLSSTCGLHADTRPRVCVCVCAGSVHSIPPYRVRVCVCSPVTSEFSCLLTLHLCLHFNILSVFALCAVCVCVSSPTSVHPLHSSANARYNGNTHTHTQTQTQIYKHTHLSGDRRRSTVGPAPVCTLAWRCSHRSGHQHLSLSPGL